MLMQLLHLWTTHVHLVCAAEKTTMVTSWMTSQVLLVPPPPPLLLDHLDLQLDLAQLDLDVMTTTSVHVVHFVAATFLLQVSLRGCVSEVTRGGEEEPFRCY